MQYIPPDDMEPLSRDRDREIARHYCNGLPPDLVGAETEA